MNRNKKQKKDNSRLRNYVILGILSVATIVLTIYLCKWISIYKEEKLSLSPLNGNINEIFLSELKESIAETNEAIIYIGYTNDEEIYDLEKKILKSVENKNLKEYVFYVNVKDYLEDDKYQKELKKAFPELKDKSLKAPLLIYTKRAVPIKIKTSDKNNIKIDDFNNLSSLLETD